MLLRSRGIIDTEQLFCSTTYRTRGFDKCAYCHSEVESDFWEYEEEYVGQPHRCTCEKAEEELRAKEALFKVMKKLGESIDEESINKEAQEIVLEEVSRAFSEGNSYRLKRILSDLE